MKKAPIEFQAPPDLPKEPTVKLSGDNVKPPTAGSIEKDAPINVAMEMTIFVPSIEQQKAGFVPYRLVKFADDPQNREFKVDATTELLVQYPGIYKAIRKL